MAQLEAGVDEQTKNSTNNALGMRKKIASALISVFNKDGLEPVLRELDRLGVTLYSTGGTQTYIESLGLNVIPVDRVTAFPAIFDGRVKTLHPKIFGGILYRRGNEADEKIKADLEIPEIDLVIVNLYPFEKTVKESKSKDEIIEKIDVGGVGLIRAAAKNSEHVLVVSSPKEYEPLLALLQEKNGETDLADRTLFAAQAFATSSHYDGAIFNYLNIGEKVPALRNSYNNLVPLRYGENPHQHNAFYGQSAGSASDMLAIHRFKKIEGAEPSLINLTDLSAAANVLNLAALTLQENDLWVSGACVAVVVKHGTPCGFGYSPNDPITALEKMIAGDPQAAFGGVVVTNFTITELGAQKLTKYLLEDDQKRVYDLVAAPDVTEKAVEILARKKDKCRIYENSSLYSVQARPMPTQQIIRQVRGGVVVCDAPSIIFDAKASNIGCNLDGFSLEGPQLIDLCIGHAICATSKSNTITFVKKGVLLANASGQQSRVHCVKLAIAKMNEFHTDTEGFVAVSDSFFPFEDAAQLLVEANAGWVFATSGSMRFEQISEVFTNANIAFITVPDAEGRLFSGHIG
jgi:phosphoribosylaminoimidazolecarboxamide formyltransferase/IMP cyclohydrolase